MKILIILLFISISLFSKNLKQCMQCHGSYFDKTINSKKISEYAGERIFYALRAIPSKYTNSLDEAMCQAQVSIYKPKEIRRLSAKIFAITEKRRRALAEKNKEVNDLNMLKKAAREKASKDKKELRLAIEKKEKERRLKKEKKEKALRVIQNKRKIEKEKILARENWIKKEKLRKEKESKEKEMKLKKEEKLLKKKEKELKEKLKKENELKLKKEKALKKEKDKKFLIEKEKVKKKNELKKQEIEKRKLERELRTGAVDKSLAGAGKKYFNKYFIKNVPVSKSFAKEHTAEEWKIMFEDEGVEFIDIYSSKYKKSKRYLNGRRFEKQIKKLEAYLIINSKD